MDIVIDTSALIAVLVAAHVLLVRIHGVVPPIAAVKTTERQGAGPSAAPRTAQPEEEV